MMHGQKDIKICVLFFKTNNAEVFPDIHGTEIS